jgi:hypothetical protein
MKRNRAGWLASYEKLKPRIDAKTESFIQFLAELALYLSVTKITRWKSVLIKSVVEQSI